MMKFNKCESFQDVYDDDDYVSDVKGLFQEDDSTNVDPNDMFVDFNALRLDSKAKNKILLEDKESKYIGLLILHYLIPLLYIQLHHLKFFNS